MKRLNLAPRVLAALLLTSGCAPAGEVPRAPGAALVELSGVVTDGLTDAPIEGARVRAREVPGEARSDAEGRFTLVVPEGAHRLWLEHPDYVTGQLAGVVVGASGVNRAVDPHLFPRAPSDATIDAYFARQPARRTAHPAHERPTAELGGDVGVVRASGGDAVALPDTIRVWRARGTAIEPTGANGFADRSCDAAADVLELPREEYVKGVIPHEWFPSWHEEALMAGAIAARTYAVNWWRRGGRWDCADVDDGTVTQVYDDDRADPTNAAVDATAGQVVTRDGAIIGTEYSAENSDPTEFGVAEPTCTGTDRFGHGRGMCQWGTHRWASQICANEPCDWGGFGMEARDHVWMVEHYFPGACVAGEGVEPTPCELIGAAGATLDDTGPCLTLFGPQQFWRSEAAGFSGGLRWTNAFEAAAPSNWARWRLFFEVPGAYDVEVYVDATWGVYPEARYEVVHAGGTTEVRVDQGAADGWVPLGQYTFEAAGGSVSLFDNESGAVPADQHIVADAVRLTPAGATPADAGPPRDAGPGMDAGPGGSPLARQVGESPLEVGGGGGLEGGCAAGPGASRGAGGLLVGLAMMWLWGRRRR